MADKYYDLIYNHHLYPPDFVRDFGESGKHWNLESNRMKELSLRHDLSCIYLCNLEGLPYHDILCLLSTSRKRKPSQKEVTEPPRKVAKTTLSEAGPSTSSLSSKSTSSSSKTSSSDASVPMEIQNIEIPFRYILIEGMPSPELIQNEYAQRWGIEKPTSFWDIIDVHLEKLIEVKVSMNPELAEKLYESKKIGLGRHTALCIIDPKTGVCTWRDHPGGLNGEAKVMQFIITRYEIMRQLGIVDTAIQDQRNLNDYIFCDKTFREWRDTWIKDWWPERAEKPSPGVYSGTKYPLSVEPKDLLTHLTNLDEVTRELPIQWKGKLLPEGWVYNITEEAEKDSEMINKFFLYLDQFQFTYYYKGKEGFERERLFQSVVTAWNNSEENVFSLNFNGIPIEKDLIYNTLGVGAKERVHDPADENTIQPEVDPLLPRKYDCYFDEILRRLTKPHGFEGKPLGHLIQDIPETEHPIAEMGTQSVKTLLESISLTNGAIYSSKLTNIYSRLGGAYLSTVKGKSTHGSIALMPVYATLHDEDTQTKQRVISGVLLRGPHHARTPTDKINFFTFEIMLNNKENQYLIAQQDTIHVWFHPTILLVGRQNAIMKEDSSFVTFNSNALFVPSNLLGVMTLENQNVAPNINMKVYIETFIEENKEWFVERFVEGIVMAAVGNSRDEGYFAQLRKLFMIVFAYRRHKKCANWSIAAFCGKVNECLVDNPFSMHFHRTLLKILQFYRSVMQSTD